MQTDRQTARESEADRQAKRYTGTETEIQNCNVPIIPLRPPAGGVLLILEKVLQDDKRAPISCLLDDLMLATISRGRERTESEYQRLLEMNGFRYQHHKKILGINTFDAMLARKPCEPYM